MTQRGRQAMLLVGLSGLAFLVLIGSSSNDPPPARAQPSEDAGGLELIVEELRGVLTPDDTFEVDLQVRNAGGNDAENLRVVGTVHTQVPSRFGFQRAIEERGELGTVVDGFGESVDDLPQGTRTSVTMRRSAEELGFDALDQAGVYPLRLRLLRDEEVVDGVTTGLVLTPAEVDQPVHTAFVAPVDGPPLVNPQGEVNVDQLLDELAPSGHAQRLIRALAASESVPVTVALNGLLLDHAGQAVTDGHEFAAEQATGFLDQVRELGERREVSLLGMPYARADLVALVRGDMTEEATRHVEEGHAAVRRHTGSDGLPDVVWPPDGLDEDTLVALHDAGVEGVLLSEAYLSIPERQRLSPSPVRRLRVPGRGNTTVTALVPDPWLEDLLADGSFAEEHGRALTVQRLLAETAAVYFEQPFTTDTRGLLLTPPQSWQPPRGLAESLLDELDRAPWLRPVGLATLARDIEASERAVEVDYPEAARERELPPPYVEMLRRTRHELGSLARVLPADPETPSRFDGLVRMAASVHYRDAAPTDTFSAFPLPTSRGRRVMQVVRDTVNDVYSSVEVVQGPQVLMDDEGPVPVTLANGADVPVQVRVRLLTPRFSFAEANEQLVTLEPGERRTLTFRARVLTPGGQAPIGIVVEDPEGVSELAEGTVVVRSTGVSVAALVATAGAGVFLAVWAVRQLARRRRSEEETSAPEPETAREG